MARSITRPRALKSSPSIHSTTSSGRSGGPGAPAHAPAPTPLPDPAPTRLPAHGPTRAPVAVRAPIGRETLVMELAARVASGEVVALAGLPGMGKSAVAAAVARELQHRGIGVMCPTPEEPEVPGDGTDPWDAAAAHPRARGPAAGCRGRAPMVAIVDPADGAGGESLLARLRRARLAGQCTGVLLTLGIPGGPSHAAVGSMADRVMALEELADDEARRLFALIARTADLPGCVDPSAGESWLACGLEPSAADGRIAMERPAPALVCDRPAEAAGVGWECDTERPARLDAKVVRMVGGWPGALVALARMTARSAGAIEGAMERPGALEHLLGGWVEASGPRLDARLWSFCSAAAAWPSMPSNTRGELLAWAGAEGASMILSAGRGRVPRLLALLARVRAMAHPGEVRDAVRVIAGPGASPSDKLDAALFLWESGDAVGAAPLLGEAMRAGAIVGAQALGRLVAARPARPMALPEPLLRPLADAIAADGGGAQALEWVCASRESEPVASALAEARLHLGLGARAEAIRAATAGLARGRASGSHGVTGRVQCLVVLGRALIAEGSSARGLARLRGACRAARVGRGLLGPEGERAVAAGHEALAHREMVAGEFSKARRHYENALRLFSTAHDASGTRRITLGLASLWVAAGRPARAAAAYRAALAGLPSGAGDLRMGIRANLMRVLTALGEDDAVFASWAECEADATAPSRAPVLRSHAMAGLEAARLAVAATHMARGDTRASRELAGATLARAHHLGTAGPAMAAQALGILAGCALQAGRPRRGIVLARRAARRAAAGGHWAERVHARVIASRCALALGQVARARRLARGAGRLAVRLKLAHGVAFADMALGQAMLAAGDSTRAQGILEIAVSALRSAGCRRHAIEAMCACSDALLARGALHDARVMLDDAWTMVAPLSAMERARVAIALARVARRSGDDDAARRWLLAARAGLEEPMALEGARPGHGGLRVDGAMCAIALGDASAAQEWLAPLTPRRQAGTAATLVRGLALARAGQWPAAAQLLEAIASRPIPSAIPSGSPAIVRRMLAARAMERMACQRRQGATAGEWRSRWQSLAERAGRARALESLRAAGLDGEACRQVVAGGLRLEVSLECVDLALPGIDLAMVYDSAARRVIEPGAGTRLDLSSQPVMAGALLALVEGAGRPVPKSRTYEVATGHAYNEEYHERNVHKIIERLRRILIDALGECATVECVEGTYRLTAGARWGLLLPCPTRSQVEEGGRLERRIVERLRDRAATSPEIALLVSASRTTVLETLRELTQRGVVRRSGHARATRYALRSPSRGAATA